MPLIWVIGSGGMLGKHLVSTLIETSENIFKPEIKFNWGNKPLLQEQFKNAAQKFALEAKGNSWKIYWAAGVGNMHSSENDLINETFLIDSLVSYLESSDILNLEQGTLIFASSAGAIYAGSKDYLITESTKPAPINPYGNSKLLQESIVSRINNSGKGASVILYRITTLYGPKKLWQGQQGLIAEILKRVLSGDVIHIYVPLETMRDYITAKDAAKKMIYATSLFDRSPGVNMKIIASENSISIAQILSIVKRICKNNVRVITKIDQRSNQYRQVIQFKSISANAQGYPKQQNIIEGILDLLNTMQRELTKSKISQP